jgi:hypothetical protein
MFDIHHVFKFYHIIQTGTKNESLAYAMHISDFMMKSTHPVYKNGIKFPVETEKKISDGTANTKLKIRDTLKVIYHE